LIHVNATKDQERALEVMPHDPLIARADAAIDESRSLSSDRCAIRDDAEASRATLRATVIDSMIATDRSITAGLLRRERREQQSE
jgi:hypothetical protein